MIIIDDLRTLFLVSAVAAITGIALFLISPTEPECPAGSIARDTRSGWFCVVPEVKR